MKKFVLTAITLISIAALTANASLIHHWEFENSADDSVGSVIGTLQGGAAYADGKIGNALSIDGIDDFVSTNVTSAIVPATDYTMAAWVFWDGEGAYRGRIAGGQLSGGSGEVFNLSKSAGADSILFLNLLPNNATSQTVSPDNTLSKGIWMHVAYTLSSTEGVKLYLDGNVVASNAALTIHTPADNFAIGARPDTQDPTKNPDFLDGLIDDLRIYNTALSGDDIADLMAIPEPATLALLGLGGLILRRRRNS